MESERPFVFSIEHNDETRTVNFTSLPSYEELSSTLAKIFCLDPNTLNIRYHDDEGDEVSAKTDLELRELYDLVQKQNRDQISIILHGNNLNIIHFDKNNYFSQAQDKLTEVSQILAHLAQTKEEDAKQLQTYEREIEQHEQQNSQLLNQVQSLSDRIKQLEQEKEGLMKENAKLQGIAQNLEDKTKQSSTLQDALTRMGLQLQTKFQEVGELKKENSNYNFTIKKLEAKVSNLEADLEAKNSDNLQLSKIMSDVTAEKDALKKRLEKEMSEKENLEKSVQQWQTSKFETPDNYWSSPHGDPIVVSSSLQNKSLLECGQNDWKMEQELLERLGYKDKQRNLQLLNQYQDIAKVVSEYKNNSSLPIPAVTPVLRNLPSDISEVDIKMLESMGFIDLDKNIELLRKHKNSLDDVLNELLLQNI